MRPLIKKGDSEMLIEIHMLQNHAPSNLNRDDTGSPKDCIFGGIRRARISSQCLKRSIRCSPVFEEEMQGISLAWRTRLLPQQVKKILVEQGMSETMAEIAASKASGFGNKEGKEQKVPKTAQMMFLSPEDVKAIAETLSSAAEKAGSEEAFKKISVKDLQNDKKLNKWRPITPDIALFGRMITSDAFKDVEASMQVAHAISTNKMDHEFDYYTAVDDLQGSTEEDDSGAGMIGDVEYNSACFYKYFSLDCGAFLENLIGPTPSDKENEYEASLAEAKVIATKAIRAFIKAAVYTTPSGKQNSFAAHQLPDAILVEIRPHKTPVSYANAFVKPARAHGDTDLVQDSIERLIGHAEKLNKKFNLQTLRRLWFTTYEGLNVADAIECETIDDLLEEVEKTGMEVAVNG